MTRPEFDAVMDKLGISSVAVLEQAGRWNVKTREDAFGNFNGMDTVSGRLYDRKDLKAGHELTWDDKVCFRYEKVEEPLNVTNLNGPQQLYLPESFLITALGVVFSPGCEKHTRDSFVDDFCLELWVGQKQYFRCPVAELFSTSDHGQYPTYAVKGKVSITPLPLLLSSHPYNARFYTQFAGAYPHTPATHLRLWVTIEGVHVRGIC